jgi:hypothetical protein
MTADTLTKDEQEIRKIFNQPSHGVSLDALRAKFEYLVQKGSYGLPIVWLAPAGSKKRGHSDHWVPVVACGAVRCSCGALIVPFPASEPYLLEAIAEHFKETR